LYILHTLSLLLTRTTGLFHKGEQAVEDGKAAADSTLSAAERKAKAAADEAARTAQDGKEQAKGVFGGESHSVHIILELLCFAVAFSALVSQRLDVHSTANVMH
jgi:hypothetical protein